MKVFEVSFSGSYLGGVAIVMADSKEEAMALVGAEKPQNFTKVSAKEIKNKDILYMWDGDY